MARNQPPTLRNELQQRRDEDREALAEQLLKRLDPFMSILGVVFLLVVLIETVSRPQEPLRTGLAVVAWLITGAFVAELALRMIVAPSALRFLRRNWWQVLFVVLPFLRILRLAPLLRLLRTGRILSSVLRATRTAQRRLTGRLAWLAAVTVAVILGGSQLLYLLTSPPTYGEALHRTALATVAGQPTGATGGAAAVLDVVLVGYSMVVFASLAGALGAFLLEQAGWAPAHEGQPTEAAVTDGGGDDGGAGARQP